MRYTCLLLGSTLLAGVSSAAHATIVVDRFDNGLFSLSSENTFSEVGATTIAPDTLGGTRAVAFDRYVFADTSSVALNSGGPLTVTGTYNNLDLGYGYSYQSKSSNVYGVLAPGTSLNADISGTTGIDIDVSSVGDGVSVIVTLQSVTGPNTYASLTTTSTSLFASHNGDFVIPYSALTATNGGANLSDISGIAIGFQSTSGFSINEISLVPEPATASVLMLCGTGMLIRRRRNA